MNTEASWNQASRVLCVRLDSLGDVLMTTPALRALRAVQAGRQLTLLTSAAGAAVAPLIAEIDEAIIYDAPWLKSTAPRTDSQADHAMIERLRQGQFDAAIIFTVYSQNPLPAALLCYLANIPLRLAHCRENPYQLLTDWVPDDEPQHRIRHEVRRQLDLVATVGGRTNNERLSIRISDAARQRMLAHLRRHGIDPEQPWLVMHPGATAPARRYPPESFAAAARRLVREDGMQIVFTGTAPEHELIEYIRQCMQVDSFSLAGQLTLEELAALLEHAPLLIANNTGPVHLAAAVDTPVVDLYALTNPQHTPWQIPQRVLFHDVPCKYCYKSVCLEHHHACLRLVSPDDVVSAARALLAAAGGHPIQ